MRRAEDQWKGSGHRSLIFSPSSSVPPALLSSDLPLSQCEEAARLHSDILELITQFTSNLVQPHGMVEMPRGPPLSHPPP